MAFINNDSLVVKRASDGKWVYYSLMTQQCALIQSPSLKKILEEISATFDKGNSIFYFNPIKDRMLSFDLNEDTTTLSIYSYFNGEISSARIRVDTIVGMSNMRLYEARWVNDSSIMFFTTKDIMNKSKYFVYNVMNGIAAAVSAPSLGVDFEIEDSSENRCLVSLLDKRFLCEVNPISGCLSPVGRFDVVGDASCSSSRIGLITPTVMSFMTTTGLDYHSFEPYLNYCKTSVSFIPIQ